MDSRFYLYFPSEDAAKSAAEKLRADGYEVETRLGADEENWLTLASRDMTDEEYSAADERMEELADSLGGEFDGAERAVS